MSQNARSHRKLKIAGVVALVVVVALLGFAGNFLFDFALNPRAPYTMKMMQDSKNDKEGEQPDAEDTEARAWFKENRESSSLTADDGTELAAWYFAASESAHDYAVCILPYSVHRHLICAQFWHFCAAAKVSSLFLLLRFPCSIHF